MKDLAAVEGLRQEITNYQISSLKSQVTLLRKEVSELKEETKELRMGLKVF